MPRPHHKGKGEPDQLAHSLALPQYVPYGDVARRIGLSFRTLRHWAQTGLNGCPAIFDLGEKRAVMRLDEVLDWIETRRVIQPADTAEVQDARPGDEAPATDVA